MASTSTDQKNSKGEPCEQNVQTTDKSDPDPLLRKEEQLAKNSLLLLQDKDLKIARLRQINAKLVAELKNLSESVSHSLEKAKLRPRDVGKHSADYGAVAKLVRDKELENALKMIKTYQREVASLKLKLDSQSGVSELENKLKEDEGKIQEQQLEIKTLKGIQKKQEKELGRVLGTLDYDKIIKELSEQLKAERGRVKDLERKVISDAAANTKLHAFVVELQEKYKKIKEEQQSNKSTKKLDTGLATLSGEEKKNSEEESSYNARKQDIEVLQNSLKSLQRRCDLDKAAAKKTISSLQSEITALNKRLKEAEQENRLSSYKLKELIRAARPSPPQTEEDPDSKDTSKDLGSKRPNPGSRYGLNYSYESRFSKTPASRRKKNEATPKMTGKLRNRSQLIGRPPPELNVGVGEGNIKQKLPPTGEKESS